MAGRRQGCKDRAAAPPPARVAPAGGVLQFPAMRVLARTVLGEVLLLWTAFTALYMGVILAGVAVPLLKQGAPFLAVLAFLPEQGLLLSLLALPLALVTALLACLGRMREDGEMTALQAAGVGTWRVVRATLPLAILLALWAGLAAHLLMPALSLRLLEGRGQLLRQALAAKVERRRPVWQHDRLVLSAHASVEDRLVGLFGVQTDPEGGVSVVFAPEARWTADSGDEDDPAIGMELRGARMIVQEPGDEPRIATAVIPAWSVRIPTARGNYQDRADALSTGELLRRIRTAPEATPRERKLMRNYERAWHTRLMMPVAVFSFWAFACGIGLAIGRGNRMLAACIGVVVVVATLFPAIVLAKEVGERLAVDAAVWVWPMPLLVGLLGIWLLRRNR